MDPYSSIGRLSTNWDRYAEATDRIDRACRAGEPIDLAHFLPPASDARRYDVLVDLVKIELRSRWREGQAVRLEDFLQRYPDLGTAAQVGVDLIEHEYRARLDHGDTPTLGEFRERFPAQFDKLKELVRTQQQESLSYHGGTYTFRPDGPEGSLQSPPGDTKGPQEGYRLLDYLGGGAFADVWKAEGPGGVLAAVKIVKRAVDEKAAQTERRALELVKQLNHPFLLQTHGFWIQQDRLYIAMELADSNLRDLARKSRKAGQPVPVEQLVPLFVQSAEAIDFLHESKVVHRDIKPENILLLKGFAKVADFGLAVRHRPDQAFHRQSFGGTPPYIAPEIWQGRPDPRCDQYSLAVTYAEMRLGRQVFTGSTIDEFMECHLHQPPGLDGMPDPEQRVLRKALAKDPLQRYLTCKDFARALERVTVKKVKPGSWVGPALAAVLLTAVLVFVLSRFFNGGGGPSPAPFAQLPEGYEWEKNGPSELHQGLRYPTRIEYVGLSGERVPFLLMVKRHDGDPPTFYIMETKVWHGLFEKFAAQKSGEVQNREWEKGGVLDWEEGKHVAFPPNPLHPVLGVHVEDAYRFARHLGGNLPKEEQWDRAAGKFDAGPPSGPFDAQWNRQPDAIAIDRIGQGPLPVRQAQMDVSPHGCRDMAGNGLEWTRCLRNRKACLPLASEPGALDRVQLRGQSYLERKPFLFIKDPGAEEYQKTNPEIGFRVVVEPNGQETVARHETSRRLPFERLSISLVLEGCKTASVRNRDILLAGWAGGH